MVVIILFGEIMASKIRKMFQNLQQQGHKALIPFITAGDPDLATTTRLIPTLAEAGADIIELGVPFSDPMADGPVIQKADERALAHGTSLSDILKLVQQARSTVKTPILLMGYYNPILAYGLKRYAQQARQAGVDATLVVDLPPEAAEPLNRELRRVGIDLIFLLTPTSDEARIRRVCRQARGFLYFVSMTGVTGGKLQEEAAIRRKIGEIRRHTDLPVVIGFGISKPAQARQMARLADGIVIGSALVAHLAQAKGDKARAASQFLKPFRKSNIN